MKCHVCESDMRSGLDEWHWQCNACGYEAASFDSAINDASRHSLMDESRREQGLKSLRECNFRDILQIISRIAPPGRPRLLDVGAAHGWFVKLAAETFDVLGIEPDQAVCNKAKAQGVPLIEGYFPGVLALADRFDVIVFNDVFEHIPDVQKTLESCMQHLTDNGLLVLNLPSSEGFFYKVSKILKRLGFGTWFDRMWQKDLPSPHLHYFNSENLLKLTKLHGFEKIYVGELPSIRLDGLFNRISYVGGGSALRNFVTWIGVVVAIPFLKLFDSDIAIVIVRKKNECPKTLGT